ncbi:hypothetical protein [Foetidibacter luteolus]|uniref:hypothetical protein n=1 Tax=Foetidibacter luteolus TaxID=2608880 RepID=UPI00129B790E|nr:hypothetical protein [Foetidibacter luteolus]
MKTETYIRAAIAALMIFSLFSCRKTWDYIKDHPKTELKFCNIKKIADPASDWKEMVFTYNALGNPISILPIVDIDYGIPAYFFKYDKYNRLIAFAQVWNKDFSFMPDQGACENFHKYVYLSNGNVIDSFFQSAWFGPNGEAYNGGYVSPISEIEFDALGRIKKEL